MEIWQPTSAQARGWHDQGYFVVRGLLARDVAMELRGVVKNEILTPAPDSADLDPQDPMDDSPGARAARFRKLNGFGVRSPLVWDALYASAPLLRVVRHFLGDDLLLKFSSVFLKPARTGSATPWHQDNGLWRDGETQPFNFWMALDPATRANGCLQFIPGSHRGAIVPHVLYENSIHGELPRESVAQLKAEHGLRHVELEPGDCVCWHSSLYHYSPPNRSDQSRISMAGVYATPALADANALFNNYRWALRGGEPVKGFPPEKYELSGARLAPPPFARAAEPTTSSL